MADRLNGMGRRSLLTLPVVVAVASSALPVPALKIYTVTTRHSDPRGPQTTGVMLPTRGIAEQRQRQHGGDFIDEEEVPGDSETAADLRQAWAEMGLT